MSYRLTTLGSVRLVDEAGRVPHGLSHGRALALLIFLALNAHRRFSRDHLAELLWPGRRQEVLRRGLRQALWVLRKALGPEALATDGQQVAFSGGVAVDAAEFKEAIRAGEVSRALELYRGDFLDSFAVTGLGEFEHWADGERERLRVLHRGAVLHEVDCAVGSGLWDAASSLLDRIEQGDVVADEELAVRRIEVLELAGRREEARAAAQRLQALYAAEPALEMSPGASAVLARVQAEHRKPPRAEVGTQIGAWRPSFVGRGEEYAKLLEAWRRASSGAGMTALVTGDAGVGKSRLIEEVLSQIKLDGATVLASKNYEFEAGLLYGSLVDVLRQAIPAPGFASVSNVWLAELGRLLPELVERYPSLPSLAGDGLGDRRRFYEAVGQVFEALAYEAPLTCVLDDLHWADDATLELLHYLSRRLCAAPVLIIVGLRPGEASESLVRLQRALVQEQGGISVELVPLHRGDVQRMLASLAGGSDPPGPLVERLWKVSEGNPFFVVAGVEALIERGALRVQADRLEFDETALEGGEPLPQRVRDLITARLTRLSDSAWEVLDAAAVLGRSFSLPLLSGLVEIREDALLSAIEELTRCRILVCQSDGESSYGFAHDQVRAAIYAELTPARRARLHSRIAEAGDSEPRGLGAAVLAFHYARGGKRELAHRYALAAAEWAEAVFAHAGARELLQLAAENAPDPEAEQRARERLEKLAPGPELHVPETRRGWRRRVRFGSIAAAVVFMAGLGLWLLLGRGNRAAGAAALPPLPQGLLVYIAQSDSSGFAVIDPERPELPPTRVPPEALAGLGEWRPGIPFLLSPDAERVAFTMSGNGVRPDVYVARRDGRDTIRLTTHPADDVPLDWLPDGSGVLIARFQPADRGDDGYDLGVARLDGNPVRMLSMMPWNAADADWAPDGTKIGVLRLGPHYGIWVTDANGSEARVVVRAEAGVLEVGRPHWAPDGSALAFTGSSEQGVGLFVARPKGGEVEGVVVGGEEVTDPVWAPDGSQLFFGWRVGGNLEVYSVRTDGSGLTRLTYTQASEIPVGFVPDSRPAYVDEVVILAGSEEGLRVAAGDSVDLTVAARDSRGITGANSPVRWRCVPSSLCRVSDAARLLANSEGVGVLIADVGGWRGDTVRIAIVNPEPRLVLEERWEQGIQGTVWHVFGAPEPAAVASVGREGSHGFVNRGDDKWESGALTVVAFDASRGLSVEVWGRLEFVEQVPNWQGFFSGLTVLPPQSFPSDGPQPQAEVRLEIGSGAVGPPPSVSFGGRRVPMPSNWDPREWHRYALQWLPDGRGELWVDGKRTWRAPGNPPSSREVRVVIGGRASHAPVVHDDIRVYEGVLYR